jgi:hypothetical protein
MDPGISCGARKLTQTSRIKKKEVRVKEKYE